MIFFLIEVVLQHHLYVYYYFVFHFNDFFNKINCMLLQNFMVLQRHLLKHQQYALLLLDNHQIDTIFDFQMILYKRSNGLNKQNLYE